MDSSLDTGKLFLAIGAHKGTWQLAASNQEQPLLWFSAACPIPGHCLSLCNHSVSYQLASKSLHRPLTWYLRMGIEGCKIMLL